MKLVGLGFVLNKSQMILKIKENFVISFSFEMNLMMRKHPRVEILITFFLNLKHKPL